MALAGPSFALCSRQITTPAPHHSIFYRLDAIPDAQPTESVNALKATALKAKMFFTGIKLTHNHRLT